jgi:hypothetical protein
MATGWQRMEHNDREFVKDFEGSPRDMFGGREAFVAAKRAFSPPKSCPAASNATIIRS